MHPTPTTDTDHHAPFMRLALAEARAALAAGEFPVGCVLVRDGRVLASGRREKSGLAVPSEIDHAEMVALRRLLTGQPGVPPAGLSVYATMEPCLMCFAALLLSGVRTIVYAYEDAMGGGTNLDRTRLAPLYRNMEVTIVPHVLRTESLDLFQAFFRNPANDYWRDSYLMEYTLAQGAAS